MHIITPMFAIDPNAPPIAAGYSPLAAPGCNIRRLRKQKGWSMQVLADRVAALTDGKTNRSTISRYERNQDGFTWANMNAVAQALEVSIEDLMTPPHLLNLPPEINRLLHLPPAHRVKLLAVLNEAFKLIQP